MIFRAGGTGKGRWHTLYALTEAPLKAVREAARHKVEFLPATKHRAGVKGPESLQSVLSPRYDLRHPPADD